ncbi:hypothetical protein GCM10023318_19750 [Nocardia callitridis]|uniref:Uncharacterized protein n=1 Tax=Nocardia callitridis TaxID=648753 RepID=A0ABP9K2M5_9NOCA
MLVVVMDRGALIHSLVGGAPIVGEEPDEDAGKVAGETFLTENAHAAEVVRQGVIGADV